MNWDTLKCLFGHHDFEETGIKQGVNLIEVICKRCNKLTYLDLFRYEDREIIVNFRIKKKRQEKP